MKKLTTKLKSLEGMMLRNSTAASFLPVDLFTTSAATGVWFDPSDLSTLFQDSAGTIPVTGMEQPVGLMLDKSKGLVRGPTLLSSDFSTTLAGWSSSGGAGTATRSNGKAVVTSTQTSGLAYLFASAVCIPGKMYEAVCDISNISAVNPAYIQIQSGPAGSYAGIAASVSAGTGSSKTCRVIFTASGTDVQVSIRFISTAVGQVIEIGDVSLKELPGNHAIQATAASRPILTARKNLLLNTHLSGGTDGTYGAGAVPPTGWIFSAPTPSGAVSFTDGVMRFTASNQRPLIAQKITVQASTKYCLTGVLKTIHSGSIIAQEFVQWANLPSGCTVAFLINGEAAPSYSPLVQGDTVTAILNVATTAGLADARFGAGCSGAVTCDISAEMPQVENSPLPTRYQRVNTATDHDYAGFPIGLRCDGVDDGMVTGSINFTGTDKMFVCAGVRKLSDATSGALLELSATSSASAGSFGVFAPNSANSFEFRSGGSIPNAATGVTGFNAPISTVVSGSGAISSDASILRLNGVQVSSNASDQGSGNFGNYPLYPLYLFRRGGTTLPFNGLFYGVVIAGTSYSATQVSDMELFMSARTKEL